MPRGAAAAAPRHSRQRAKRPDNVDAWDSYQRGMYRLYLPTREDVHEAQTLFARPIDLDPNHGPAHTGSAEADVTGFRPDFSVAFGRSTHAITIPRTCRTPWTGS
jgi:hypothetical protein